MAFQTLLPYLNDKTRLTLQMTRGISTIFLSFRLLFGREIRNISPLVSNFKKMKTDNVGFRPKSVVSV